MSDGKVPMPADGQDSAKTHSDGVEDPHGRAGGGESGGGHYENPHSGKTERGEAEGFDGGQSGRGYYGPGQLDGKNADPDRKGAAGQGGDASVAPTPDRKPRHVTADGQSFDVIEASGIAEAEVNGTVGTQPAGEREEPR